MEQATRLRQAREVFATLVAMLPEDALKEVLGEDVEGPRQGGRWPLDRLEICYRRMVRYAAEREDPYFDRILPHVHRYKRQIDRAREALVLRGIPIVLTTAPDLADLGVPVDDLIHAGNHGLHQAIDRFDSQGAWPFSTYARSWVRRAMLDAINARRPPEDASSDSAGVDGLSSPDEPREEVADTPLADGSGGETSFAEGEVPEDAAAVSVLRYEVAARIQDFLNRLPSRDAEIVRLRFGIDRVRSHSIGEIARLFCVSRDRILDITERAFRFLEADVHRLFATHPGAIA
jgi:RNA polymerase sigma factor (sigma-70 family)